MKTLEDDRAHKVIVRNEIKHIKAELALQVKILGAFLATFWGVYLVNNVWLNNWIGRNIALEGRSLSGVLGFLATPFMHLSTGHVIASSILLVVLGWWVMLRDTRDFFLVHILAMLGCGAGVWLFEPGAMRWFGWGGVAMGMAGYLLTSGIFERRISTILSSVVAMFLIGSPVLFSLMPGVANSWWGVSGGFFGGVLAAAFLGWRRRKVADPADYLGKRAPSAAELVGLKDNRTVLDFSSQGEQRSMYAEHEELQERKR